MARKKHLHLAEAKLLPNLIHDPEKKENVFFSDSKPLTLELGCGKGEYTLSLAAMYPERNFIGIDKKADRLWFGAKKALALGLKNVKFIRLPIENISEYFPSKSIHEIWLTFPDPFPRRDDAKKRLLSPDFQARYQFLLKDNGYVHLKTDNAGLFLYTKEILSGRECVVEESIDNVHASEAVSNELAIQTTFERKHREKGDTIHYLRWHFVAQEEKKKST